MESQKTPNSQINLGKKNWLQTILQSYSNQNIMVGPSLVVQWLRIQGPNAGSLGLIPGQGTRSLMPQLRPGAAK